ncbi:MAG: amidohydrolase family protein [Kofleriaceae bacterium]
MHDLVIRGGNVVDGTGAPGREVDVAIDGETITAVGPGLGAGKREVDARGLLVTPGFVDVHTHFDAQVSWDPYLTPSSWHGCTSVIMGNCGVGFAPAHPDKRDWLIQLMEGVEDIPGAALTEGIQWGWETFPEYLDFVDQRPHAIDVGALVSHGAVRAYVMGERGANNEDATAADIAEMREIVREAVAAGAFGFSTSRTPIHKAKSGEVAPGTYAKRDELLGIAAALDDAGRGVYQVVIDHTQGPVEFDWMLELARTGRPVTFNLQQTDMAPDLWREMLGKLDGLVGTGVPLHPQVAGRAIGLLMCWEGTAQPFGMHPTYLRLLLSGMSVEARLAELRKPEVRAQILSEQPVWNDFIARYTTKEFADFITTAFHKMYLVEGAIDYEPPPEANLVNLARATGKTVQELAYDHLNTGGFIYFPLFNYAGGSLEPTRVLHQHPMTRMGLSDAGAHCGAICDGGMPTFMLTHWARDRSRGPRLPLELVIQRMTSQTAQLFGLRDRGVLAPGMLADVNVIDHGKLAVEAPKMVYDLPAKGRRLLQRARGYVGTWKRGQQILDHDEHTGTLPGKLLRCQPA